jgi:hypothetical protein
MELSIDEDETNEERAKEANEAPDSAGGETRESYAKDDTINQLTPSDRTDSEQREATDKVTALIPQPHPGSLGKALASQSDHPRRPTVDRTGIDSDANWSERDWADSADDSEDEENRSSTEANKAGWNWTEAIAGKRASSPKGTDKAVIDEFLGKTQKKGSEVDTQFASDAAAARVLSGEAAGMGVGLESAFGGGVNGGVTGAW